MISVPQCSGTITNDDDLEPAAALLKKKLGRKISPATLWRWHNKGCRGVRLDCKRVGGFLYTTAAALSAFIAGQNSEDGPPTLGEPEMPPARPASRVRKLETVGLVQA